MAFGTYGASRTAEGAFRRVYVSQTAGPGERHQVHRLCASPTAMHVISLFNITAVIRLIGPYEMNHA